jgi:hypothetical protein
MLRRFLKLSFFTVLGLLVPYYLPIVIFGNEVLQEPIFVIWVIGFCVLLFSFVCILLLMVAFNYVVYGR